MPEAGSSVAGRLNEGLQAFGLLEGEDGTLNRDPPIFAELAEGAGDGLAGGAGHRGHLFVGEEERKAVGAALDVFADLVRELEEEAREAGGDGFGEGDAAGILEREAVFLADALNSAHLGFFVRAQEGEESIALNGAQLSVREGLGGDLVEAMREHRIEAEHRSWAGDAHDHLAVMGTAGGQLNVAAADEIEAACFFPLGEEGSFGRQGDGGGGEFEIGEDGTSE